MRDVDIATRAGHFPRVNTMTILLGATFALLLAAVVLSFNGMNEGVRNAPPEELARLRSQIEQLRIEQDRMAVEREYQRVRDTPIPETTSSSDMEKMKAEIAAKEAEISALSAEKNLAEKKADTYNKEAAYIGGRELEKNDNELRRSRLIRDALLIGKIKQYVSDPAVGNFAIIDVVLPEHVEVGVVLAIRRNTGILGTVTITEISPEGAIGSPMPGFGPVVPEPGDELIIPPSV